MLTISRQKLSRTAAAMLTALLVCGCADKNLPDEPTPQTVLSLRVTTLDRPASRWGGDIEDVTSLRLLVVDARGYVEVNDLKTFTTFPGQCILTYKLISDEKKKVYAIGNPEATGFDFEAYPKGTYGLPAALEAWSYELDTTEPLPLSDMYMLPADSVPGDGEIHQFEMNLVRNAVKFSVNISNRRDEDIVLESLAIHGVADRQYLLPHFTAADGCNIVATAGAKGFEHGDATGLTWSQWMKLVADESLSNTSDPLVADRSGWLMHYGIPAEATHFPLEPHIDNVGITMAQNATVAFPAIYAAESRNDLLETSTFGNGDAAGLEQQYSFDITFESPDGLKEFTGVPIPNLRSLFRNTHVVLNITIQEKVVAKVSILPYSSITLDPVFGWVSLPATDAKPDPDLNK